MTESLEVNVEHVRQLLFLAGLLGGFSFTVVVQVISGTQRGKMILLSAVIFLLSSLSFLFALIQGLFLLSDMWRVESGISPRWDYVLVTDFLGRSVQSGLVLFMLGAGTIGWAYSKLFGVISFVASLSVFALLVWANAVSMLDVR